MTARLKNLKLTLRYEDEVRLFRTRQSRLAYAVGVVAILVVPLSVKGDFWLSVPQAMYPEATRDSTRSSSRR